MSLTPDETTPARRTKRRYAHEMYPHAEEWQTRPLEVEVPYLYARAIGFDMRGTGWFEAEPALCGARTHHMVDAQRIALMADAMLQGLIGQAAWEWVEDRMTDDGEWIYQRAMHYGVDPDQIKPYPCGPKPKHHEHLGPQGVDGSCIVTRAPGAEDDCEECTEPITESETTK